MKNRSQILAVVAAILATVTVSTSHAQSGQSGPKANKARPAVFPGAPPSAPTIPPQPAIPPGLSIGSRQIVRQDVPSYIAPGASAVNEADVSARVQGATILRAASSAPLWAESDQSSMVVISLGDGYLPLDKIDQSADVTSVRVHDEAGNSVVMAQRVIRTQGQTEAIEGSVRVDGQGNLLPLPVVRVLKTADGTVILTRDSNYAEMLSVEYRLIPAAGVFYSRTYYASIHSGESTAVLSTQPRPGDTIILRAGNGYTPAPGENSDVIRF